MGSIKGIIKLTSGDKSKISLLKDAFGYSVDKRSKLPYHPLSLLDHMKIFYGHKIPKNIKEAKDNFKLRKNKIVKSFVLHYATEAKEKYSKDWYKSKLGTFWGLDAVKSAIPKIIAGLHVFKHKEDFTEFEFSLLSGEKQGIPFLDHLEKFKDQVDIFFTAKPPKIVGRSTSRDDEGINFDVKVGTRGDFDFALRELISLVYMYREYPDLLSTQNIYHILTLNYDDAKEIPITGQNPSAWLSINVTAFHQSETENHVLMINCWRYLVQNYLEWVAHLPTDHYRYDKNLKDIYKRDLNRYKNTEKLTDMMLQILGRVLHNGMFETNAKPYETYSTLAILTLYSYAADLFPEDESRLKVKLAAGNALDYLAAKFTFQGFEGKRYAPMRRNYEYKGVLDFYQGDHFSNLFGVLSGWYVFPDIDGKNDFFRCDLIHREDCPYHFRDNGKGSIALYAALSDYQIPTMIHDFMLHRRKGWWARMQSKYTGDNNIKVIRAGCKTGHYNYASSCDVSAKYFNDDGTSYMGGKYFKPVPQVYFITKDFANIGGGEAMRYYPKTIFYKKEAAVYNVLSKPTVILTKGIMRFKPLDPEGKGKGTIVEKRKKLLENMSRKVALMPGNAIDYQWSSNFTVYKNFTFGICNKPKNDWPQYYPDGWNTYLRSEFKIGVAEFRIFHFREGSIASLRGHYLVFAKIHDNHMGIWEVIPIVRYDNYEALKNYIITNNPPSYFSGSLPRYQFNYKMTTGEKLKLELHVLTNSDLGFYCKIKEILNKHGIDITARYHFKLEDIEKLRNTPLIDVWEVNEMYEFTGRKYASSPKPGVIEIINPFVSQKLTLDSSSIRLPKRIIEDI